MTIEKLLDAYTVTFAKSIEDDGYIARYRELGYSARGVGRSKFEALYNLRELVLDTMADVPLEKWPPPGEWVASHQSPDVRHNEPSDSQDSSNE